MIDRASQWRVESKFCFILSQFGVHDYIPPPPTDLYVMYSVHQRPFRGQAGGSVVCLSDLQAVVELIHKGRKSYRRAN